MYKKTLIAKLSEGLEGDILSAFVERAEGVEEVEGSSLLESLMSLREEVEEKDDTKKKDPKKGSKAADKSDIDDENAEEVWNDEDDQKYVEEAKKVKEEEGDEFDAGETWDDEEDQDFPDDEDEVEEEDKKKKSVKESVLDITKYISTEDGLAFYVDASKVKPLQDIKFTYKGKKYEGGVTQNDYKDSSKKEIGVIAIRESFSSREITTEEISIEEDVNALFEGEELTEDFKEKATVIFEAAVARRVSEYKELVNEAVDEIVAEEVDTISEELTEKIDKYLDYVVEEWMEKNDLAIEHGIRTEITEGFIAGLKNLFIENYVEVPEGKENVLDATIEEKSQIEEEYEESIRRNIKLAEEIRDLKKGIVIAELSKGLADTEVEKLEGLAEELTFNQVEEFTKKVKQLKESYFRKSVKTGNGVDSDKVLVEELESVKLTNESMKNYVDSLGRFAK
jgi:hypothetical protein